MKPNYTTSEFEEPPETRPSKGEGPLHGFRGEPEGRTTSSDIPAAPSIAMGRQAGARGGSLGRRVGRMLGWEVYGRDLLEYILREEACRWEILERLTPAGLEWVEKRLDHLRTHQEISQDVSVLEMARIVLALGARGEAVFIGRGAGYILPAPSTLHVRVVAPLADRETYMAQWLRLTLDEAAEQVRLRDVQRSEFLATHFGRPEGEVDNYDLVLNSRLLGEEMCADLVVRAVRAKATEDADLTPLPATEDQ
jgi:cytidylate kinase